MGQVLTGSYTNTNIHTVTLHLSVTGNGNDDKLDKIAVYFNEANGYSTYVPRSVNIDLVGKLASIASRVFTIVGHKPYFVCNRYVQRCHICGLA